MSTSTFSRELWLLGMRRTGKITPEEFLKGIRLARICTSRTEAERCAYQLLAIHGRHPKHASEYELAVGHLTKWRLMMNETEFSSLFVSLLMDACITVAEAKKIVAFITSDYRAGALELVRIHQAGKISRYEVELAVEVAVTAKSSGEAERLAQQLLYAHHARGVGYATPLEFAFCVVCLYSLGEGPARDAAIAEIKRLVYAAEEQKAITPRQP